MDIKKYWWVVIVLIGLSLFWQRADLHEWFFNVFSHAGE
nr:MAG TPA: Protein of unknown function (DUF2556) [Caudoviricetes sp.]